MYTIIGGDGREYGPVTADQVRAWIAAGRANLDTQAKELGTTEWKRLGELPAFNGTAEPPLVDGAPAAVHDLAGRWPRLAAYVADTFIYALCLMPVMNPVLTTAQSRGNYSFSFSDMFDLAQGGSVAPSRWLPVLVAVAVQIGLLSLRGQTLGKLLLRIRIVRFGGGLRAGFVHAFLLRSLLPEMLRIIPFLGVVFWLVDIGFIFREDRRCLHDLIAGTVVVAAVRRQGPV
jgi:uncharacterized RDD family membrane protein YckC